MPATRIALQAEVPHEQSGKRLDQIAAHLFPDFSRARLQSWIKQGQLLVNGKHLRPKDKLQEGDSLVVAAELEALDAWEAQPLALNIVYEDEYLLVLNKSAGTVVHPAAGNYSGTLLNGLLHHCSGLQELPRAGIVHRLDKDTTGLMVVAKTLQSHAYLVNLLQERNISREYEAIVQGVLTGGGTIDAPIGRHPVNRKKQAVNANGRHAVTHYRVAKRFRAHTHVHVKLETGRTHQIRVHMAHINHSLVGDPAYGGRFQVPAACTPELSEALRGFRRQALHAARLTFVHPVSAEEMTWEAPLPDDIQALLVTLASDTDGTS